MQQKSMSTNIWTEREFSVDELAELRIGHLRFWYKLSTDELWIAYKGYDPYTATPEDLQTIPEEINWSRWAFKKKPEKIRILPVFPNRSVVAKPEYPFSLAIGAQAKIYVRVPVWLQIEVAKRKSEPLLEIPTVILSNTWFGTFTDGELCYWLSTRARREISTDQENPHLIICPVHISNTSEDKLLVEKLRLQVKGLSLYNDSGQLWADETLVSYRGQNDVSRIEISGKIPNGATNAELIMKPREPIKKGFAARTFTSISNLSGFDIFR